MFLLTFHERNQMATTKMSKEGQAQLDKLAALEASMADLVAVNETGNTTDGNADGTAYTQLMPETLTPTIVLEVRDWDNNFNSALRNVVVKKGVEKMADNPGLTEVSGSFDMLGGTVREMHVARSAEYWPSGKGDGKESVKHYGVVTAKTTMANNYPKGVDAHLREELRTFALAKLGEST